MLLCVCGLVVVAFQSLSPRFETFHKINFFSSSSSCASLCVCRQMDAADPSLRRCGVTDDGGIDAAGERPRNLGKSYGWR